MRTIRYFGSKKPGIHKVTENYNILENSINILKLVEGGGSLDPSIHKRDHRDKL